MAHTKIGTYAVNAYKPKNLLEFSVLYNSFQTVYYVAIPNDSKPEDVWRWKTRKTVFHASVFPTKQYKDKLGSMAEIIEVSAGIEEFNKKDVIRNKPNSTEFIKYDAKYTFIRFVFIHPFEAVRNLQVMFNKDQQIIEDIMRLDNENRERMFHTKVIYCYWDDSDL